MVHCDHGVAASIMLRQAFRLLAQTSLVRRFQRCNDVPNKLLVVNRSVPNRSSHLYTREGTQASMCIDNQVETNNNKRNETKDGNVHEDQAHHVPNGARPEDRIG